MAATRQQRRKVIAPEGDDEVGRELTAAAPKDARSESMRPRPHESWHDRHIPPRIRAGRRDLVGDSRSTNYISRRHRKSRLYLFL
jgi:hypothetical protein